jgi:hypothetical protein
MKRYFVHSGPLKITIAAPSAYEAALEAVRWWDDRRDPQLLPAASDADHRAQLDAAIEVRASRTARSSRLFPTFNLLARASGESPARAWERVLREKVGQAN